MNIHEGSTNRPRSKPLKIELKAQNNITSTSTMTPTRKYHISNDQSPSSVNPFLIDLVLIKIFGYVKKKDFSACRHVCTKWNLMLIPRFREEFEIYVCTIDHSKPLPPPVNPRAKPEDCKFGQDHKSLERFVKLMSTSICIPFTKFRLDLNSKANGMTEFFRVCGPEITHVTLVNMTITWYWSPDNATIPECALIENLKEMFMFLKNLECLRFNTRMFYNKEKGLKLFDGPEANLPSLKTLSFQENEITDRHFSEVIEELIAHSPNLVNIDYKDTTPPNLPPSSMDVLSTVLSTDKLSTIQNLSTESYKIQKGFVDQVEKCGLKLKKLHIKGCDFQEPQHLHRLIELQKNNLHDFKFNFYGSPRWIPTGLEPELPRMKNLKFLKILVQTSLMFSMQCTKQPFHEKFPNVEIMLFYFGGPGDMSLGFLGSKYCPKLKSFELDFFKMDVPGFQNMTEIYSTSALTSLKLDTGLFSQPEILKLIWTNLTNLQELQLVFSAKNFSADLDTIFTGISSKNCKEIKKNPDYWNFMETKGKNNKLALEDLVHELCISPSISDLKRLHRLSLKFPGIGLTDITGYLGLYELENIKHIHIDFCEFSKKCCESLMNQWNLESWVFRQKNQLYVPCKDLDSEGPYLGPFCEGKWTEQGPNEDIVPPYIYPYKESEHLGRGF